MLLWVMLILSSLGAIETLTRPQQEYTAAFLPQSIRQQVAVDAATGFVREWMTWSGEELPEARQIRLKPYVSPDQLVQASLLQVEQKSSQQQVLAVELLSLSGNGSRYIVSLRVTVANPHRLLWEAEVPVWMETGKSATVAAIPLLQVPSIPPTVPEENKEAAASGQVRERMRPTMESFLKAMCEGKEKSSLLNYVTATSNLTTLEGRLRFLSLEQVEVRGTGPYLVTLIFGVQEESTGFRLTQRWKLIVVEQDGKFFVEDVST